MVKQIHAFFSGSVQGVGFRFRTRSIATRSGVFGWVRNVSDGRVEVLAQGTESNLGSFLNDLRDDFSGYIKNEDVTWEQAEESFEEFAIKLH